MRILHYSLGFPPYRSGGMTKFCMDLMQEQKKLGHDISLLWPGEIKLFGKTVAVKDRGQYQEIGSYEIINPLPVSYDEGIIAVDAFTASCDMGVYVDFLKKAKPDVVHLHTLIGLHKEFLEAAQSLGIRTVFTVHDFYAVCPKVTMFRSDAVCPTADDCENCPKCNLTALSLNKITALQSPLYRYLKDSSFVKKLRKHHRDQYLNGDIGKRAEDTGEIKNSSEEYKKLRNFYGQMLSKIDMIHYNSSLTKDTFEHFFSHRHTAVISISHSDIKDNRKKKEFGDQLRLTYLGPQGEAKGYFRLKKALDALWEQRKDFILNVFFTPSEPAPYLQEHGRYAYSELEAIFDKTDLLVTPSIWYETFGYTTLEALSYGVPVMVSDTVGAKDIIPEGCGIIVKDMSPRNIMNTLNDLTKEDLVSMNRNILENAHIRTLSEMNQEIVEKCYLA